MIQTCTDNPGLTQVMEYQHPQLVNRLVEKEKFSATEAICTFEDLKRFLYLCAVSKHSLAPTPTIDSAWHHFILFTQDYAKFCRKILGEFVHHVPHDGPLDPNADERLRKQTLEVAKQTFGTLSKSWEYSAVDGDSCLTDCTRCGGTTNCQT